MDLRHYQRAAIDGVRRRYRHGHRAALVILPTGTGKTFTALSMVRATIERGGRVLWLAHRSELVEQPVATWDAVPDLEAAGSAGIVQATRDQCSADLVCASVQTIGRDPLKPDSRLARILEHGMPRLVVVDEAHHSVAGQWMAVLDALRELATERGDPEPWLLGLTATPERTDSAGLAKLWGDDPALVYSYSEAIEDGYLCPPRFIVDRLAMDDETKKLLAKASGDDDDAEMAKILLKAGVVEHTAQAVGRHLHGRRSLIFTCDVQQARETAAALRGMGRRAEWVSGETSRTDRRSILRRYMAGEVDDIANCGVLTEGTDLPICDAVVYARPFSSKPLYIQATGRGLRLYPGKVDCICLDLTGASEEHSLIHAAALVHDGEVGPQVTVWIVRATIETEDGRKLQPKAKVKGKRVAAGSDDVEISALIFGEKDEVEIEAHGVIGVTLEPQEYDPRANVPGFWKDRSRVMAAWVTLGAGQHVCDVGENGLVFLLEVGDEGWMTYRVPKRARKPRALGLRPCSQEMARALGDDVFRQASGLVRSAAAWRTNPPSDKQAAYAARLGIDTLGLSAGEVADAISAHKGRATLKRIGMDAFRAAVGLDNG